MPVNRTIMITKKQQTRWIFYLSLLLIGWSNTMITAQSATLNIENLDQLCAGFTDNSTAKVKIITDTPFRLPSNAGLVFDWYAYHDNAKKRWNTPLGHRQIPVPWAGEYNIWVVVKYVNKRTLAPFRTFKSPVITINMEECPETQLRPATNQRKKH